MMPFVWKGSEIDWFRVFEIREWCQSSWNSNSSNWHMTLLQRSALLLSNLWRMLKLSGGGKSQTQSICYPSQGQARSLNLRKKLRLERKRVSHPLKSRVIKVATVVWEIMIIKVVRSKWKKCHHCNKNGHIVRACKYKKRETQAAQLPVNYVDSADGDSDDYLGSLEVNNVSDKDHFIWVSPDVQGRVVKMELDTGSVVSVLPYKQ